MFSTIITRLKSDNKLSGNERTPFLPLLHAPFPRKSALKHIASVTGVKDEKLRHKNGYNMGP